MGSYLEYIKNFQNETVKEMGKHFTKEGMQMAKMHMQIYSLLANRAVQIKTMMRWFTTHLSEQLKK